MPIKKSPLVLLATTLIIALTDSPANGFSFTLPSQKPDSPCKVASFYCIEDSYSFPDFGTVTTTLEPVESLLLGGTNEFFNLLSSSVWAQNGWTFQKANQDLEGYFQIGVYRAYAQPTPETVGANIQMLYHPLNQDPTGNNVHWIQRVVSNHGVITTLNGGPTLLEYGTAQDKIDVVQEQTQPNGLYFNPFYDTFSQLANSIKFEDFSTRPNVTEDHEWYAELYLVELTAPKTVTIHNGISWGWKHTFAPAKSSHNFSDSLSSGTERDNFYLDGLTPGATFHAWTNNDLPSNQCNPNTYLSGYDDDGYFLGADDNSSHVGNGFASSVLGTVSTNGTINLSVKAADGGRRGEDEGNYELYVNVYDAEDFPLNTGSQENNSSSVTVGGSGGGGIIVGGSGGGGIIVGNEDGGEVEDTPGRTQQNPILPSSIDSDGWQTFSNVPGCRWYDPPIEKGFEFVATDNTLFTEILDFPVGEDDLFTVIVDDMILGEFSPGDRVDFVSLLGAGVSRFKVTDIDYFIGDTVETYFPIQLAFDKNVGSFKMRPIVTEEETPKKTPESSSIWGLIVLCAFGVWKIIGLRNRK